MWESRIESLQSSPIGVEPINEHYYLLQTAYKSLQTNNITNQFDKKMILKPESELAKLSTNQLKLWIANFHTIDKLNKLEHETGPSEPLRNPDTIHETG